jgi:hypothetical protein
VACEGRGGEPEVRGKPEEGRWRLADDVSVGTRRKTGRRGRMLGL